MVVLGVAVPIPEPWGSRLRRARTEAGDPEAARVPPHITLLGPTEVEDSAMPEVERHLAEVASNARPFTVLLRGTGTFRPVTEVVFAAVAEGISDCEKLQAAVRAGPLSRELSYPYHPHVTVAHDVPAEALDAVFEELADFHARFRAAGFTLYAHSEDLVWRARREFRFPAPPTMPPSSA